VPVGTAREILERGVASARFTKDRVPDGRTFGVHVTYSEPSDRLAMLIDTGRHQWSPRIHRTQHLDTMLNAGVHHAGWWIATPVEPEEWLVELAKDAGLRRAGAMKELPHLLALRAWAEARLSPLMPEELVRAGDEYASGRAEESIDFLTALSDWLRIRAHEATGYRDQEDGPQLAVASTDQ
jgi:hypothetical protein